MRRRVEEERKSLRRDARTIMATTLAFAAGLALFSRSYMAPYSTVVGQVVLSGVVVVFVVALAWIRRLSEARAHERFLVGPESLVRAHHLTPRATGTAHSGATTTLAPILSTFEADRDDDRDSARWQR